jgi:acyl-CoA thioesterase-1
LVCVVLYTVLQFLAINQFTCQAFADDKLTLLFLGDSLTAGFGVDPERSYPSLIAGYLEDNGIEAEVINAGVSGDTSSSAKRRINWLLRGRIDLMLVAIGANDGLRGLDLSQTEKNIRAIITQVRQISPQTFLILAGMKIPPNMGQRYTDRFTELYPRVARELDVTFIPFLLEGVAGETELNLPDGIHPNAEGHMRISKLVWSTLKPVLLRIKEKRTQTGDTSGK